MTVLRGWMVDFTRNGQSTGGGSTGSARNRLVSSRHVSVFICGCPLPHEVLGCRRLQMFMQVCGSPAVQASYNPANMVEQLVIRIIP
jgi:hypothetical protein